MEEAKAAAYYDELSRKGEAAARFKRGLGFSSSSSSSHSKPSSFSLLSSFVRTSSPTTKSPDLDRADPALPPSKTSSANPTPTTTTTTTTTAPIDTDTAIAAMGGWTRRRRRRGRGGRRRDGRREVREREREWRQRGGDRESSGKRKKGEERVDYSRLIEGYDRMTPAERVKAEMMLLLSETAAADDASLVKDIGKCFRLSAVEAKREEELRAAHDEAMFGVSSSSSILETESTKNNYRENHKDNKSKDADEEQIGSALISDKVFSMQQGSLRDQARKFRHDGKN